MKTESWQYAMDHYIRLEDEPISPETTLKMQGVRAFLEGMLEGGFNISDYTTGHGDIYFRGVESILDYLIAFRTNPFEYESMEQMHNDYWESEGGYIYE